MIKATNEILVSFILPVRNCDSNLSKFIEKNQKWSKYPVEFCVVDGASTDNTADIARNSPLLSLICSEPDRGIYDAWNKGITSARGRYISFIGVDDDPNFSFFDEVRYTLEHCSSYPDVIYGDARLFYKGRFRRWISPSCPKLFTNTVKDFDIPHPGSYNLAVMFTKIKFNPDYRLAGDLLFYLDYQKRYGIKWIKVNKIQADIGADGASRDINSCSVYELEHKKISDTLNVEIRKNAFKIYYFKFFLKFQFLFFIFKDIKWAITGSKKRND